MQLTSVYFFLFTLTTAIIFFFVPARLRWLVLLTANIYFYLTWSPEFFLFTLGSIAANFYIGRKIDSSDNKEQNKKFLIFGILMNVSVLFVFKYASFFLGQLHSPTLLSSSKIKVPIGISFYTLQMIAYLLDIYSHVHKSETDIRRFSLFATFFPLLISGPIERAKTLLPQFSKIPEFNSIDAREGLKRIGWGVFKKLVIADRLAIYVDQVFNNPSDFHGLTVVLAVIFFAFQLYCDFSGYTDIVLGVARILGYKLTENFKNPYFSNSIQKFWNTWHISLSTWLRDYIFFPLRRALMRRKKTPAWLVIVIPSFFTMLISGLWHGEGLNYLLWGMLHGIYLVVENILRPVIDPFFDRWQSKLISWFYQLASTLITFSLVCFAWVFFRSNNLTDAFSLLANMKELNLPGYLSSIAAEGLEALLKPFIFDGGLNKENLLLSIFLIIFLLCAEFATEKFELAKKFDMVPKLFQWLFYLAAVFGIILLSTDSSTQNFIYFNF